MNTSRAADEAVAVPAKRARTMEASDQASPADPVAPEALRVVLNLVSHDNPVVSSSAIAILKELTPDFTRDKQIENGHTDDVENQILEEMQKKLGALVRNFERLERRDFVNTYFIIGKILEFKPALIMDAANNGLLRLLLDRLADRKRHVLIWERASKLLLTMLEKNKVKKQLGELDGVKILLQLLSVFNNPATRPLETETGVVVRVLECLSVCFKVSSNREAFHKEDGFNLICHFLGDIQDEVQDRAVIVLNNSLDDDREENRKHVVKHIDVSLLLSFLMGPSFSSGFYLWNCCWVLEVLERVCSLSEIQERHFSEKVSERNFEIFERLCHIRAELLGTPCYYIENDISPEFTSEDVRENVECVETLLNYACKHNEQGTRFRNAVCCYNVLMQIALKASALKMEISKEETGSEFEDLDD